MSLDVASPVRPPGGWRDYLALARTDHWIKHIFIVPGLLLAWVLPEPTDAAILPAIALGLLAAMAASSANYVINEWLDAPSDAFHPLKSNRPAVVKELSPVRVYGFYAALALASLLLGAAVSKLFLATIAAFLLSGVVYNVRPLRTKDRVYLDVLSESVNNPIRLTLGWAMINSATLPPSSLLLAFWMGGAFLMAMKRFAEFRSVAHSTGLEDLGRYRKSFQFYSQTGLLLASYLYATLTAFFLAVFMVKYRIEYLLTLPIFLALCVAYLRLALQRDSSAQAPERLFRERGLIALVALLAVAFLVLTWVDVPIVKRLADPHYIQLGPPRP